MMVDERLRVVDAFMPELGDIERGMARKAIRVDDAVRLILSLMIGISVSRRVFGGCSG